MNDDYDLRVVMRVYGDPASNDLIVACDDAVVHRFSTGGEPVTFIVDDGEYGSAGVALQRSGSAWVICCQLLEAHLEDESAVMPITIEPAPHGQGLTASFPMYSKTGRGFLLTNDGKTQVEFRSDDYPRSHALN